MQNLMMNRFYKKSHVLEIVFIDLSKNNDSHILPYIAVLKISWDSIQPQVTHNHLIFEAGKLISLELFVYNSISGNDE